MWCGGKWGKDSARRKGGAGGSAAKVAARAPLMGTCLETEARVHGPWEWRRDMVAVQPFIHPFKSIK